MYMGLHINKDENFINKLKEKWHLLKKTKLFRYDTGWKNEYWFRRSINW